MHISYRLHQEVMLPFLLYADKQENYTVIFALYLFTYYCRILEHLLWNFNEHLIKYKH